MWEVISMKRAVILLLMLVLAVPAAALAGDIEFAVTPDKIDVNTFYNGTTITVAGRVPEGSQVVLRFTGAPGDVRMKLKGKALGLLWMNMDSLHFKNVPAVSLVESTVPLKDLGQPGEQLSLQGLSENIGIEPVRADRKELLAEMLKLKEHEGLFRQVPGAVKLGEASGGMQAFSAQVAIPSRLSPGDYVLEAFAVKNGQIAAQGVKPMEVRLIGIPALMADLAFNHGAWYGVLASIIAILGGLAIGLVFQSKGAH